MSDSESASPEADQLFEIVKRRYCDGLTDDELSKVRASVGNVVKAAEALRAVELEVAKEPRAVFVPFSPDGEDDGS